MQLTKEQVQAGIAAGLVMTDPNSDVSVPMKHCAGVLILRELLLSLGGGQLALVSALQQKLPPAKKPPRKKRKRTIKAPPKKRVRKKK